MPYIIGLIFVLILILISIDDLIWDIFYTFKKNRAKKKGETIDAQKIDEIKPKMLAIIVAAYNEEAVLKDVIENLILSNQYPRSMYHIFLGVYPNDPGTMKVAKKLAEDFDNVHKIIHVLNGPSSKADNLNNVIENIYDFESENHIEFAAIVIHDSEDLVHPYELKFENYLLEKYPLIQIPVFPLQEMPKLSNVFKNIVSGTYADEFAENHYRLLVARTETEAFVPSAGTGFVIRRDVLKEFPDNKVFPVGSLTEDYKLSLQLKQMGYGVHYALENVSRLKADGSVVRDFISVRSMFPNTYKAAVKQKTRWIHGITMQTFKLKDIFKNKNLNFASKYSLYRDWKAKIGNLVLGPGYLIFTYFVISLFFNIPTMYPIFSFSWYLMLFLSIMMIQRQVLRFIAVKNVYGYKSAIISSVFPPLLPFRMVVGNTINFHATVIAWLMNIYINKNKNKKIKKKPKWSKTDHEFLEERILARYRRSLGDTLLYKGLIDSKELDKALDLSKANNEKLGVTLNKLGLVSDVNIVKSVCEITQNPYLEVCIGRFLDEYKLKYKKIIMNELKAIPLFNTSKGMVVLATLEVDETKVKDYFMVKDILFVYTTAANIDLVLNYPSTNCLGEQNLPKIEKYIEEGSITLEQGILALNYTKKDVLIESTLNSMGLLISKDTDKSLK
ncbi:MAG: phage adsorption protein NrfB [Clostridium sp.]|nr:phage adsorption protein NrfB [Clostridium sp.]